MDQTYRHYRVSLRLPLFHARNKDELIIVISEFLGQCFENPHEYDQDIHEVGECPDQIDGDCGEE